jgi:hypothetical protein
MFTTHYPLPRNSRSFNHPNSRDIDLERVNAFRAKHGNRFHIVIPEKNNLIR